MIKQLTGRELHRVCYRQPNLLFIGNNRDRGTGEGPGSDEWRSGPVDNGPVRGAKVSNASTAPASANSKLLERH